MLNVFENVFFFHASEVQKKYFIAVFLFILSPPSFPCSRNNLLRDGNCCEYREKTLKHGLYFSVKIIKNENIYPYILLIALCLVGLICQSSLIIDSYLRYETTTVIILNQMSNYSLPSLSTCFNFLEFLILIPSIVEENQNSHSILPTVNQYISPEWNQLL